MADKRCGRCGAAWEEYRTPGHNEKCECGGAWHACGNCRFCDPLAQNWCREPSARLERPRTREEANYCSWFVLGDNFTAAREAADRAAKAKAALAALSGEGDK